MKAGNSMFTTHGDVCTMRIYDENENFIAGYNLRYDIPGIIKILKQTNR